MTIKRRCSDPSDAYGGHTYAHDVTHYASAYGFAQTLTRDPHDAGAIVPQAN